jgi:hypothetical protein
MDEEDLARDRPMRMLRVTLTGQDIIVDGGYTAQ